MGHRAEHLIFEPKPHWEVGERAGILDLEAAARITGARFAVYKGWGARLERALANFFLDVHTREHGYTEILPPFLVNTASLMGAGQLPKFAADLFRLQDTDFWLTPTSEVELHNLYREQPCLKTNCPFMSPPGRHVFARKPVPLERTPGEFCANISFRRWNYSSSHILRRATKNTKRWCAMRKAFCKNLGLALPHHAPLHRRHGLCFRKDLRPGSVAALEQRIPRNLFLLQLRSLSGSPGGYPL